MRPLSILLILFLLLSNSASAQDEISKKNSPVSPSTQPKSKTGLPVSANKCVAECQSFEERCKSPQNTVRALNKDKQMGRPFGSFGALGILLGQKDECTRSAKECITGCASTGKAIITIGSGNIPIRIHIPAKDAAPLILASMITNSNFYQIN